MQGANEVSHESTHSLKVNVSRHSRFIIYELLLIILGLAIAAQVLPPDVYSQILWAVVVLTVTLPVSYWLAYKRQ